MNFSLYAAEILLLITISHQSPHIFQEKETCEISVQYGKKLKHYLVPARVNTENEELRVSVLLCTKDDYVPGGQSTYPEISVYDKTSSVDQKNKEHHHYDVLEDQESVIISLSSDIKCTNELNYTVSIKLEQSYLKKPSMSVETECDIEIKITHPNYEPSCKKFLDGKWFIDLSPLRRKTFNVRNKNGESLIVSLCGPAFGCNNQAGCKIQSNETIIFGSVKEQKVKFDYGSNAVSVSSSINDAPNKNGKKSMLVHLKCNWNVPYFSNPKLLNEGKNFKFEVESSFGCVKFPPNCLIQEKSHHLTYDLRSLSNKDGTIVANAPSTMRLNICGDLQIKGAKNNRCHAEKSQVCEIQGNSYTNRGSISHFEKLNDGNLKASFRDGHQCNINGSFSTVVNLICSSEEKGPVFVSQENCLTNISWETPKACPMFQIDSKTCSFHSSYGDVDLNELYTADGFTELLSGNRKLNYNICGRLNFNCSKSDQASVCLIDRNRQKVIGWNQPTLSYIDGELRLKYTGEKCQERNKPYSLTMNMMCSFGERQAKPVVTEVDECTFIATVTTSSACLKPWEVKNCTVDMENYRYDLGPLIRRDRNYEIADGQNRNRTYFMNLCAPIIPRKNLLFHPDSMVSMRDSSVALITKRFPHLGKVTEPIVQDGNLVVKLTGEMCEPGVPYSTKIFLECSNNEESPTILNSNGCSLEFRWMTKYACPIMKRGGKCSITDGTEIIEVPGGPIEVKTNNFDTYYFSLCMEYYRLCTRDNLCVTQKLSKRISNQNDVFYAQLNLNDGSALKTANLIVECDQNTYLSTSTGQVSNPAHIDVHVRTRISCDKESRKINRAAEKIEPKKENEYMTVDDNQNPNVENSGENIPKIKPTQLTSETTKKDIEKNKESHKTEIVSEQAPTAVKEDEATRQSEKNPEQAQTEVKEDDATRQSEKNLDQQKTELKQTIPNGKCNSVTINEKSILLKDLEYKEFKSVNGTFIINFDGNSTKCGGLLCKNGRSLLNFIENCPQVSYEEDQVNLDYTNIESGPMIYTANSSTNYDGKKIEISLRCTHEEVTAKASETNTKITVYYSSPKVCALSESSYTLTLVFVVIGILLFSILCFVCYVLYRKDYFKKCSYDRVSEDISFINHSKLL